MLHENRPNMLYHFHRPSLRSATGPAETMSYRELEESINKWTVELEEQEKSFLHQAAQVNAWDRTLVVNGEKVSG